MLDGTVQGRLKGLAAQVPAVHVQKCPLTISTVCALYLGPYRGTDKLDASGKVL